MSEILYTLEEAKQKWPEYTGIIGNRFNNISGQHINSLKILYRGPNLNDAKKRPQYVCQCDCGSYCLIKSENITSKAKPTKTCGHCKNFQLKNLKKMVILILLNFLKMKMIIIENVQYCNVQNAIIFFIQE
jgi:hypothetical protein